MTDSRYIRQLDIISTDAMEDCSVLIIGAGAVGSFVALALAKMGVKTITVYDPDTVEEHNIPNQFYRLTDIGSTKVEALRTLVKDFCDVDLYVRSKKFEEKQKPGYTIVIIAVDSMDARVHLWNNYFRLNTKVHLYIDVRMAAEVATVHSLTPWDMDMVRYYEQDLFPSQEAFPARCTERAVVYTILGIAAVVSGMVKKLLMHEAVYQHIAVDFRQLDVHKFGPNSGKERA